MQVRRTRRRERAPLRRQAVSEVHGEGLEFSLGTNVRENQELFFTTKLPRPILTM